MSSFDVVSCWQPRPRVQDLGRYVLTPDQVASLPPVPHRLRRVLGTSDYARVMAYYAGLDEEAQRLHKDTRDT